MKIILLIVVVVATLAFVSAHVSQEDVVDSVAMTALLEKRLKNRGCAKKCAITALVMESRKNFRSCLKKCNLDKSEKFDNTALTLGLLEDLQEITYEENVQAVEADDVELLADAESTTEVSSKFKSGSKLRATTAVRVRSGPCTNKKTLTTVPSGGKVTFKGAAQNGCGYKWIKVSGSFGTGWTAENFWTKSSSGGGSSGANCKNPVHFPEFRQCDNRWRNNKLGSKTICAIGCLMSSVSMGLNGHNRKINGQASNPATLNSYLSSHGGYSGNLFIWGSVSKFGFSFAGKYSATSARAYVCSKSHVVILNVRNGGHWVLATGLTSTGFTVNDPAGYTSHYTNGQVVTTGVYKV